MLVPCLAHHITILYKKLFCYKLNVFVDILCAMIFRQIYFGLRNIDFDECFSSFSKCFPLSLGAYHYCEISILMNEMSILICFHLLYDPRHAKKVLMLYMHSHIFVIIEHVKYEHYFFKNLQKHFKLLIFCVMINFLQL